MGAISSNLAVASPAPAPASRRCQWIDATMAAQRMGLTPRQVQRMAGDKWLGLGLAKLERGDNGRLAWFVRTDAEKRLDHAVNADDQTVDTRRLTEKQRREFRRRLDLLAGWNEARSLAVKAGKTEKWATADFLLRLELDDGTLLTRQTLYRWDKLHRRQGDRGLLDERWHYDDGNDGGGAVAGDDAPFVEELKRLYLTKQKRSKALCYDRACDKAIEEGWETLPRRTAQRILERIPIAVVALHRGGVEEFKNTAASYIQRDYGTLDSNSLACTDHHRFDVWVKEGSGKPFRPWLTPFLDMRSRMITGWRIYRHDPNSDVITAAFRDACLAHGVPESIYCDHGKDFSAAALLGETKSERRARKRRGEKPSIDSGIFGQLGVNVIQAQPFNPQAKPIERFFGTVCVRFSVGFPTYCGSSPDRRPDDLAAKIERGLAPELSDFIASFGDWLEEYHSTVHQGDSMDGRTPRQVFDAHLFKRRVLTADQAELLFLKRSRPLKVGRAGVNWNGMFYGANAMASLHGKQVYLRVHDRDVNAAQVYSYPDDRFLLEVQKNQRLPFGTDSQMVRDANADKKRERRQAREFFQAKPRMADTMEGRISRKAARIRQEQAEQAAPGSGASIVPVRTALDDQIGRIAAARLASGRPSEPSAGSSLPIADPLLNYKSKAFDNEDESESGSKPQRNPFDLCLHNHGMDAQKKKVTA